MRTPIVSALLVVALGLASCGAQPAGAPSPAGPSIALPEPGEAEDGSLGMTILKRQSRRQYADSALDLAEVSLVLSSAAGFAGDGTTGATRAAPSAGATHPLIVYLVAGRVDGLEPGVYEYVPRDHALIRVVGRDVREDLAAACLGQDAISLAPAAVVVTADFSRTTDWYGDRGRRYVYMEAGAVMQNVGLVAEALGLGTVAIGAFDDRRVAAILRTATDPLLVIPLGHRP